VPQIVFDTFAVWAPAGWADFTATVDTDNPPYTIAHRDGLGALQFTAIMYKSGPVPNPTQADLQEMVEEVGARLGLGAPANVRTERGPPKLAAGSFAWGDNFLRVWQLSDGRNFARATYTCAAEYGASELATCERIVRSIEFLDGN
jgi:hypothetical protein